LSCRLLRKDFPALREKFKEPVLWSRSYFVTSVTLPLESSSHSRPQTHAHVRAPAMLVDAVP